LLDSAHLEAEMRRIPLGTRAFLAIITFLFLSGSVAAQGRSGRGQSDTVNGQEVAAREVLVKLRPPFQTLPLARITAQWDPETVTAIGRAGLFRVRSRSMNTTALLALLRNDPNVVYAEPNFIVNVVNEPDDPMFSQLWGLNNTGQVVNGGAPGTPGADIHATLAWDLSTGSSANVVAIVDTGIEYTHPDLVPNIWSAPTAFSVTIGGQTITCNAGTHGFNAIERTCDPMDGHNHGTHVAGTIGAAGNNGIGVSGINWTTSMMALKFLDSSGGGTISDAIDAIEFAIQAKAAFAGTGGANIRVLSNSWSGGGFSQALLDEINAANDSDMLFVAAAGNNGTSNDSFPKYPSGYNAPNVIAVAATTNTDGLASFSNYGAHTVHLGAPGVTILSTIRNGDYGFYSGTSMATPHVSGAAALVLSQCPSSTTTLKDVLVGSVQPVTALASRTISGGRLDVNSAIRSCVAPPPAPQGLTAQNGDTIVKLTWSYSVGATSYRVKRGTTSGGPYTDVASGIKAAQFTDTGLTNGTTYYYVVSAANIRGESGDSNEASATPRLSSDLVVSAFTVPSTGGTSAPLSVSITTRNQGSGNSEPSTTRLYLSKNGVVDPSMALDQSQAVPALAPGASATATVSATIPPGTAPGLYFLVAKADADDTVLENQETNNTSTKIVTIGPDLALSSFTVPSTITPGATVTVTDTIKNQGGDPTPATVLRIYFSTNSILDGGDTPLGDRQVPSLPVGAISSGQTSITIPAPLAAGTYYIIAKADATDQVAESLETNNTVMRAAQIGPDLVISALTVPSSSLTAVTVTDTTLNQGTVSAASTVTRFYFSTDSILDGSDQAFQESRTIPALGPGVGSTATTTLTLPPNTPAGTYYVIAKADADGVVSETQEANNTFARAVQIGGDLLITSLTVPSKLGAGTFTITDTTKNQGSADVGPSTTTYYLSTDAALSANDWVLNGTRSVPLLHAGESSTGSTPVTIPGGLASGSYYFIAKTDGTNVVTETQESNNTSTKLVTLGPDLVDLSLSMPFSLKAGSTFNASETVTNQGGGDAAPSMLRFYLSTNATLDSGDTDLNAARSIPALAAGSSNTGPTSITIPAGTVPGFYYVLAKADSDGVVDESSETNNLALRGVQVTN
jgi:subtilisin family serine protease